MSNLLQIILVAIVVTVACSVPGVFLVNRGDTMVADAISHTVLLGIVIAYFIVLDLDSPFLMLGASLIGLVAVWLIEYLANTKQMTKDASIGIVISLFFSLAIFLLTRYASQIHLDVDTVITGEIGYTPLNQVQILGYAIGPFALYQNLGVLLINIIFVTLFYKELKLTTFDPEYASSIGISGNVFYYLLMTLVSITAVGAYDSVGSILVVAFFVGPALSAFYLTNKLSHMFWISPLFAILNSTIGVYVAYWTNTSYSGMIAAATGISCLICFLFSPKSKLRKN